MSTLNLTVEVLCTKLRQLKSPIWTLISKLTSTYTNLSTFFNHKILKKMNTVLIYVARHLIFEILSSDPLGSTCLSHLND